MRQAIRAATELQSAFVKATISDPSLPLPVGIGLDAGEAVRVEDGYRGGALNLAARLCSLAGPGEILASQEVVHLARRIEGVTQVDRGSVRLKGLAGPVRVTRLTRDGWDPEHDVEFQKALSSRADPAATANVCPYRGLAAFQPEDAERFFGRERLVAELVARLDRERVLFVIGPSGSGKSSVVRAGLIPAVQAGSISGSDRWPVALFSPRADPTAEFAHQLRQLADGVSGPGGERGEASALIGPDEARRLADLTCQRFQFFLGLRRRAPHRVPHVEQRARTECAHIVRRCVSVARNDPHGFSRNIKDLADHLRHRGVRALSHVHRAAVERH